MSVVFRSKVRSAAEAVPVAGLFRHRSRLECWLSGPGIVGRKFVGVYENCYTNNMLQRTLRTLLNTTTSTKLDSTHYAKKMAFCGDAFPTSPWSSAISGVLTDDNGYVDFNTLADIASSSVSCYGTKTAAWTNSSLATQTVKYLATVYDEDTAASNVYSMSNIDDTPVLIGQTFTVNYVWTFDFDTSASATPI